jgi:hypothetical protein
MHQGVHAFRAGLTLAVKKMNDVASGASRGITKHARTLFALLAATLLLGAMITNVGAAVDMVRFDAKWQNDGSILVVWETSTELDSTAFFLYRAGSLNGPWTDYVDFEPAAGNEFTGATYTFVDNEVSQGSTYYYRLEETAADGSSSFFGPITPTGLGTSAAPATSTATTNPDVAPTATRQYTNTPGPAGTASVLPTQTRPPTQPAASVRAAPTRALTALVTTPTPIGGAIPTSAASTPTVTVTVTPEGEQIQPTVTATASEIPTLPAAQETPSPTAQRLAAAPRGTAQPLLDVTATQFTPTPVTKAPPSNAPNPRLALFLGGGALVAAVALAALALLIWRWRVG